MLERAPNAEARERFAALHEMLRGRGVRELDRFTLFLKLVGEEPSIASMLRKTGPGGGGGALPLASRPATVPAAPLPTSAVAASSGANWQLTRPYLCGAYLQPDAVEAQADVPAARAAAMLAALPVAQQEERLVTDVLCVLCGVEGTFLRANLPAGAGAGAPRLAALVSGVLPRTSFALPPGGGAVAGGAQAVKPDASLLAVVAKLTPLGSQYLALWQWSHAKASCLPPCCSPRPPSPAIFAITRPLPLTSPRRHSSPRGSCCTPSRAVCRLRPQTPDEQSLRASQPRPQPATHAFVRRGGAAVRQCLKEHLVLVAQLQSQQRAKGLKLQQLWFFLQPTARALATLHELLERITAARPAPAGSSAAGSAGSGAGAGSGAPYAGGALLRLLHERRRALVGDPEGAALLDFLLRRAAAPFFEMLQAERPWKVPPALLESPRPVGLPGVAPSEAQLAPTDPEDEGAPPLHLQAWIYRGVCHDPHGEFMVQAQRRLLRRPRPQPHPTTITGTATTISTTCTIPPPSPPLPSPRCGAGDADAAEGRAHPGLQLLLLAAPLRPRPRAGAPPSTRGLISSHLPRSPLSSLCRCSPSSRLDLPSPPLTSHDLPAAGARLPRGSRAARARLRQAPPRRARVRPRARVP